MARKKSTPLRGSADAEPEVDPRDNALGIAEETAVEAQVAGGEGAEFDDDLPAESASAADMRSEAEIEDAAALGGGLAREIAYERNADEQRTIETLEALREMDTGNDIQWRISRIASNDPAFDGFLDTWPSASCTLERIRNKFGPGKYYLYGVRRGRYFAHKVINIAGDAKRPQDSDVSQNNFNVTEFFAQQAARDEARERAAQEREERRRRDERDEDDRRRKNTMEMITAIGAVVSPIIAAMIGRKDSSAELITALRPAPAPSPLEMIRLVKELQEASAPASREDPLEKAFKLLDFIADKQPSGGETNWLDIAKEAVKALGPTVGGAIEAAVTGAAQARMIAAQRAQTGATGGVPALTGPGAVGPSGAGPGSPSPISRTGSTASALSPAASSALRAAQSAGTAGNLSTSAPQGGIPPINEGDDSMLALLPLLPWLKGYTEMLLTKAARGSDTELWASAMFDDLPDNADFESVGIVLSRSDWFNLFKQLDSRVANYEQWFTELRGHLLELISDELGVSFAPQTDTGQVKPTKRGAAKVVTVKGPAGGKGPADGASPARSGEIERPAGPPSLTDVERIE
jgi:hypothetical protein